MSLQACADIVAKGDPDRFVAAMAAPVAARKVLFPIYAFNVEVTRAAWVTSEPMIGEMRLQWWRDVLAEIIQETPVRQHEVSVPLADVLDRSVAFRLDSLIAARRWDLYTDPFEDDAHFKQYLNHTGGWLMWVAARSLGAPQDAQGVVRNFGEAAALARFLVAAPELEARGRVPLTDGRREAISLLAEETHEALPDVVSLKRAVPRQARPALLEGWQTRRLLEIIAQDPGRVSAGTARLSEFEKRVRLIRAAIFGGV